MAAGEFASLAARGLSPVYRFMLTERERERESMGADCLVETHQQKVSSESVQNLNFKWNAFNAVHLIGVGW